MSAATLAYHGFAATDVCLCLTRYSNKIRFLYAVDALVTAIVYNRKDTVEVLIALNTPLNKRGLFGISVRELIASETRELVSTPSVDFVRFKLCNGAR